MSEFIKLFVTKQLIEKIKNQKALEVIYLKPKKLITRGDRKINVITLLIPLEGKFAKNMATIFYALPDSDILNVVVSTKGKKNVKLICDKIRSISKQGLKPDCQ